jgi:hypothetical protein
VAEGRAAAEVIAEINSRGGMCLWSHLHGSQGAIVTGKTYPTARIDIQEVTIHAQMPLAGGDWVHYDPPRTFYNGRLIPFVSELPAWLAPAQYQSHVPPASAPIVPAKGCGPGLEVFRGNCLPDCRIGLCMRRSVA